MYQTKISLTQPLTDFLENYKSYGFKDKSSMVRSALIYFQRELEVKKLKESAELYAEEYDQDAELKELTEAALDGWPE